MVHDLLVAGEQAGSGWAVPPDATLVVGDAGDQSRVGALIAAHRIDAIIHFAASIVEPDPVRDPILATISTAHPKACAEASDGNLQSPRLISARNLLIAP
jgi:hypothetical protein